MGKINISIKDETEQRFRRAIADYMGVKKGNISKALEEAINLWIENVSERRRKKEEDEGMVKQRSDLLKDSLIRPQMVPLRSQIMSIE